MTTTTGPTGYQHMIFVNLPIRDVTAARSFWEELGYGFSDVFRQDDQCECLQISDSIFAMLLSRDMYATFTSKTIIDARTTSGALLCLSAPSREAVDELVDRAIAAGGADTTREGQLQEDSMYGRAFEDPDGHTWEVLWTPPLPRADPGAPTTGECVLPHVVHGTGKRLAKKPTG